MSSPGVHSAKSSNKRSFSALDATCLHYFGGVLVDVPDGFTASLVTIGEDGWPVTSLLGAGELYAADDTHLSLALWPMSRAQQNLRRTGRASLDFVAEACFYQLRLTLTHTALSDGLMLMQTVLTEGEAQTVPYASLTTGIQYELSDRGVSMTRWEGQIEMLRKFARHPATPT